MTRRKLRSDGGIYIYLPDGQLFPSMSHPSEDCFGVLRRIAVSALRESRQPTADRAS